MSLDKAKKKLSSWKLEKSLNESTTLEELVKSPAFTEASDGTGASHLMSTRVPTWMQRQIAFLTEMKHTPYQVYSDTVRDALYLGLRVLSMRYRLSPESYVEASMVQAIDKVGVVRRMRSRVKELESGLEDMMNSRDDKQAVEGLEGFILPLLELEDEWYKSKVVQLLMEKRTIKDVLEKCSDNIRRAVIKIYKEQNT